MRSSITGSEARTRESSAITGDYWRHDTTRHGSANHTGQTRVGAARVFQHAKTAGLLRVIGDDVIASYCYRLSRETAWRVYEHRGNCQSDRILRRSRIRGPSSKSEDCTIVRLCACFGTSASLIKNSSRLSAKWLLITFDKTSVRPNLAS